MLRKKSPRDWKILVVDYHSMRILSSSLKMYEIMDEGICYIDIIENEERESMPQMHALYFISSCTNSIAQLIQDFSGKTPLYGACSVYFTSELTREMMNSLKNSAVVPFIRVLKEINIDFLTYDSQVFHFDSEEGFKFYFSEEFINYRDLYQKELAEKISQVCTVLGSKPIQIRHFTPSGQLAAYTQIALENIPIDVDPKCKLLILDRTFDLISPLLHEFTYQAMLEDLLDDQIIDDRFVQENNSEGSPDRFVLFDEDDPVFFQIRHKHIAVVIDWLVQNVKEFVKNSFNQQTQQEGEDLGQMISMMRNLPKFQELGSRYSNHLDIANLLMKTFHSRKLQDISMIEQNLSTGVEPVGKSMRLEKEIANIMSLIENQSIKKHDILRVIMVLILNKDVKFVKIEEILEAAGFGPDEKKACKNLRDLFVGKKEAAKALIGLSKKNRDKRNATVGYELSRWTPLLKNIIESLAEGKLRESEYPKINISQGGGSKSNYQWSKNNLTSSGNVSNINSSKIIVFVAGGITYSEIRAIYELMESNIKSEIIIGSTHILKPNEFIMDLVD